MDQSDLLNEQVHADELQELLARLAATDALFAEPIPTIRDVAEATDASPLLIGRILSQMRGPDEVGELKQRIEGFEARLRSLEKSRSHPRDQSHIMTTDSAPEDFKPIDFNLLLRDRNSGRLSPDPTWSEQKGFLESEHVPFAHRMGQILVGAFVAALLALVLIANNPSCNLLNQSPDRPIPFPIERSTR